MNNNYAPILILTSPGSLYVMCNIVGTIVFYSPAIYEAERRVKKEPTLVSDVDVVVILVISVFSAT